MEGKGRSVADSLCPCRSSGLTPENDGCESSGRLGCGVGDCIQEHEEYHKEYALKMSPNICLGKPNGLKVTPSDITEKNTQEYIGYGVEADCLIEKLKNAKCGCEEVLTKELEGVSSVQESFR